MTQCTRLMREAGLAYPRTCPTCQLGPCTTGKSEQPAPTDPGGASHDVLKQAALAASGDWPSNAVTRSYFHVAQPAAILALLAEIAELRAQVEAQAVPGWKLAPVEPTPTMCAKGFCVSEAEHDPAGVYRAMLAAAPIPGAPAQAKEDAT